MKNKLFVVGMGLALGGLLIAAAGTASAAGFGMGMGLHASANASASGGGSVTPPVAAGKVTAVSGDTITLQARNGTTYTVDGTNATVMKSGSASSISNVAVGDMIVVQGTVSGSSITATTIRDGVMGMMGGGFGGRGGKVPGIFGTVASVNGSTFTVTDKAGANGTSGTTYTVNASNATVLKDGTSSTISSVAVGDNVLVEGTVSGNSVTATTVRDGIMAGIRSRVGSVASTITGNGEPVVGGTVTAISGTSVTVTNASKVTYTIDVSSATVVKSGVSSTASSIAVGDKLVVQGTVNGNSVTASSVIDQGAGTGASSSGAGNSTGGPGIIGAIGGFFHKIFGFF